jgi:hypothetical protein
MNWTMAFQRHTRTSRGLQRASAWFKRVRMRQNPQYEKNSHCEYKFEDSNGTGR